jgi:hypothetical protein
LNGLAWLYNQSSELAAKFELQGFVVGFRVADRNESEFESIIILDLVASSADQALMLRVVDTGRFTV